MADIEFNVWNWLVCSCGLDEACSVEVRPMMRCWRSADGNLIPWDATCSVDKKIFQEIGCKGHMLVFQVVEAFGRLLVWWLE